MVREVTIIRLPGSPTLEDLRAFRDYAVECRAFGLMAVDGKTLIEQEDMPVPDLGTKDGLMVLSVVPSEEEAIADMYEQPDPTQDETEKGSSPKAASWGHIGKTGTRYEPVSPTEAEEKRAIQKRLMDYRTRHGVGCFTDVSRNVKDKEITPDILRQLVTGDISLPVAKWRKIGRGLEKLEAADG